MRHRRCSRAWLRFSLPLRYRAPSGQRFGDRVRHVLLRHDHDRAAGNHCVLKAVDVCFGESDVRRGLPTSGASPRRASRNASKKITSNNQSRRARRSASDSEKAGGSAASSGGAAWFRGQLMPTVVRPFLVLVVQRRPADDEPARGSTFNYTTRNG